MYNYAIFACARWEAAHISEWLTYHASVGFDHVFLCCNDDDPAELYQTILPFVVGSNPYVTFIDFPFLGQQRQMYLYMLRKYRKECNFITFLDIDEFITLPQDCSVDSFQKRVLASADVVYLNWLMFGNNGHIKRYSGSVLQNYTRHERWLHPFTKLLAKQECIDIEIFSRTREPFWHQWPTNGAVCVNVLGQDMANYYDGFPGAATELVRQPAVEKGILSAGYISHFAMKSEEDFERRFHRGVAGDFDKQGIWAEAKASGNHFAILESLNAIESSFLSNFWAEICNRAYALSVIPRPKSKNLALGKPALQSSLSSWSLGNTLALDAAGAVNGKLGQSFQFHTGLESNPWWSVDLETLCSIEEVRIFNRLDECAERANRLSISISNDASIWYEVFVKVDDSRFGGVDGEPLRWVATPVVTARFVRVSIPGLEYLHLNQVEVYGRKLDGN